MVLPETRQAPYVVDFNSNIRIYNAGPNTNQRMTSGVAFVVDRRKVEVLEFREISERIAAVIVQCKHGRIGIIGCYAPTDCSTEHNLKETFYTVLRKTYKSLSLQCSSVVVLGDFNARLNADECRNGGLVGPHGTFVEQTSDNGLRLLEFCRKYELRLMNTFMKKPKDQHKMTWYHPATKKGVILDYVLAPRSVNVTDVRASQGAEIGSDHSLVTSLIDFREGKPTPPKRNRSTRVKRWNRKSVVNSVLQNPKPFRQALAHQLSNAEDSNYDAIVDGIQKAASGLVKKGTLQKSWFEERRSTLVEQRDKVTAYKRTWLKRKSSSTRYEKYKRERARYNKMIQDAKDTFIEEKLNRFESLRDPDPRTAYQVLREVLGVATCPWQYRRRHILPIDNVVLCSHYKALFNAEEVCDPQQLCVDCNVRESDLTLTELIASLKRLKSGSAPGLNGIRPELIKYGGKSLDRALLTFFNKVWRGEVPMPRSWVDAEVISLFKKKGSNRDAANYRSIFLLDVIGKAYAGIVCDRLRCQLDGNISRSQHGFRTNLSTEQAILGVRSLIQYARDTKQSMVLIFIDLTKAFDTIPWRIIFSTLNRRKVSFNIAHSIRQMMDTPMGHLRDSEEIFPMKRGVRQGSKEGPPLFNLVFDDVLKELDGQVNYGLDMRRSDGELWRVRHIEYADDLVLITSSIEEAQSTLDSLLKILTDYGMTVSTQKTKFMTINVDGTNSELLADSGSIEKVSEFVYLGTPLNVESNNDTFIDRNVRKARGTLARLRPGLRSNLKMKSKCRMLDTFMKPILTYGLSSTVIRAKDHNRLKAVLNTCRRMILGINRRDEKSVAELEELVTLNSVSQELRLRRIGLWFRASLRHDSLVRDILSSEMICPTILNRRKTYTKDWLCQLKTDVKDLVDDCDQWVSFPIRITRINSIDKREDFRPCLKGQRDHLIDCSEDQCFRRFATVKERNLHVKRDHAGERAIPNDNPFQCSIGNCNKSYKTRGWYVKHLSTAHNIAEDEAPPQGRLISQRSTTGHQPVEGTARDVSGTSLFKCPWPGGACGKQLPTWKGICNHCTRDHAWSAITKMPVRSRRTKQELTRVSLTIRGPCSLVGEQRTSAREAAQAHSAGMGSHVDLSGSQQSRAS